MSNNSDLLWWDCKLWEDGGRGDVEARIETMESACVCVCLSIVWASTSVLLGKCTYVCVRLANGATGGWLIVRRRQGHDTSIGGWWLHYLLKDRWKHPSIPSSTQGGVLTSPRSKQRIELIVILHFLSFFFFFWPDPEHVEGAQRDALCLPWPSIYSHCFDNPPTPFSGDRAKTRAMDL